MEQTVVKVTSRTSDHMTLLLQSATVESYFDAKSLPALTSDHTLAKLDMPRIDQEQLQQALQVVMTSLATGTHQRPENSMHCNI